MQLKILILLFSLLALCLLSMGLFLLFVLTYNKHLVTQIPMLQLYVGAGILIFTIILIPLWAWFFIKKLYIPLRDLAIKVGVNPKEYDQIGELIKTISKLRKNMRQTQAELEESHVSLRQTEKLVLVGKLAAGVAHSIRNPLTAVKLRIFSLTKGLYLKKSQQDDLVAIDDAIRHMESITANFLEFSRRPRLHKSPLYLRDVVENTMSLLKPRLQPFKVKIEYHEDDYMPMVNADAEQLREALANIILNACEAMGIGGTLHISEESGHLDPLDNVAVIKINDSGPGIPEDMCEAIFQPFISTKMDGTGLGLSIARKIFEEHGGWLHLHNLPGKGATFVAVLPAIKDDDTWIRF